MAAASGSVAKLYRFPPTRELRTDYDTVVPAAQGRRRCARELEEYLRRREEAAVDGENLTTSMATSLHLVFVTETEVERDYPVIVPPVEVSTDVGSEENK